MGTLLGITYPGYTLTGLILVILLTATISVSVAVKVLYLNGQECAWPAHAIYKDKSMRQIIHRGLVILMYPHIQYITVSEMLEDRSTEPFI